MIQEQFKNLSYENFYINAIDSLVNKFDEHRDNLNYFLNYFEQNSIAVRNKSHGGATFYKFKYRERAPFDQSFMFASRGIIIIDSPGGRQIVPSLNKFFNIEEWRRYVGQTHTDIMNKLASENYQFILVPKYDGSNVQVFADNSGRVHIYTLGSLEENTMGHKNKDITITFKEKVLDLIPATILDFLISDPFTSIVFEILSNYNHIVTHYEEERLVPLVIINSSYLPSWAGMHDLFPNQFGAGDFPLNHWHTTLKTLDADISGAINNIKESPAINGKIPEGLVLYAFGPAGAFPMFKIKTPEYKEIHKNLNTRDEAKIFLRAQILELFGNGVDTHIDDVTRNHMLEFRAGLEVLSIGIAAAIKQLQGANSRADYAKVLNSLSSPLTLFKSALFASRDSLNDLIAFDFIIRVLTTKTYKGGPLIYKIHEKENPFWFNT